MRVSKQALKVLVSNAYILQPGLYHPIQTHYMRLIVRHEADDEYLEAGSGKPKFPETLLRVDTRQPVNFMKQQVINGMQKSMKNNTEQRRKKALKNQQVKDLGYWVTQGQQIKPQLHQAANACKHGPQSCMLQEQCIMADPSALSLMSYAGVCEEQDLIVM